MKAPRYFIRTFGCQMNYSDSQRVARVLELCGFKKVEDASQADLVVVNTCSVRQKAEDKAYGFIVNQKRQHKAVKIAVTGCMVRQTGDRSTSKDKLLQYDPIDLVFRIEDAARLPKILEHHFPEYDFSAFYENLGEGTLENYFRITPKVEHKAQVFVPIMQGCDKFCTYCIVPYTRGREISRSMDEILAECEAHVNAGAIEITLLGQNVNSYRNGPAGEKCFHLLLREIDKLHEKGLKRLRFTSPHPQDFTPEVIEALAQMKTACPYIHLPAQHGSNRILKAMNRNYTVEHYENIIAQIRAAIPEVSIATDIIIGFPGESEEDFELLCDFARRVQFDFSYTAIFSPRKHTPASKMEKDFIDIKEKKRRFHIFDEIIQEIAFARRAKHLHSTKEVLVEKSEKLPDGTYWNVGRTPEFFEVFFPSGRPLIGSLVPVRLEKQKGYIFEGIMPENTETPSPSLPTL